MANVLSTSGTWMQKVAQNWLVLTVGGSPFYLGLDAFLGELPILLLTLVGGVIADRHDRRRLLVGSQCVQLTSAFTLAALVYLDLIRIWHVLALSFTAGIAQAFGGPAYQSLMPSLVPRRDLPNAVALNSIQFNLSRILGPLVAGLTLATVGMAACFALNGLSFFIVIAALLRLDLQKATAGQRARCSRDAHRAGVRPRPPGGHGAHAPGVPHDVPGPAAADAAAGDGAREVFAQGVEGYSRLMVCSGAGAVIGALVVAWLGRYPHMGRTALIGPGGASPCWSSCSPARAGSRRAMPCFSGQHRAHHPDLDRGVAGPARRARRDAGPGDEHFHGRVSRRDAARQPRVRQPCQRDVGADRADGRRRAARGCVDLVPDEGKG